VLALRPARSAAGHGVSDISVNRRLHLKDRNRTLVSQNVDGYTDRTLTVVRIDAMDETPIASIVGYGSHPIILAHQNRQISPDYPGVLKRVFEKGSRSTGWRRRSDRVQGGVLMRSPTKTRREA
jgi:hypothetical protein